MEKGLGKFILIQMNVRGIHLLFMIKVDLL